MLRIFRHIKMALPVLRVCHSGLAYTLAELAECWLYLFLYRKWVITSLDVPGVNAKLSGTKIDAQTVTETNKWRKKSPDNVFVWVSSYLSRCANQTHLHTWGVALWTLICFADWLSSIWCTAPRPLLKHRERFDFFHLDTLRGPKEYILIMSNHVAAPEPCEDVTQRSPKC